MNNEIEVLCEAKSKLMELDGGMISGEISYKRAMCHIGRLIKRYSPTSETAMELDQQLREKVARN